MSMSEMTRMLERASTDAEFARGLVEAVGGKQATDALTAVAAYGAAQGFSVTAEDAAQLQRQMMSIGDAPEGDLLDCDLETVAGGIGHGSASTASRGARNGGGSGMAGDARSFGAVPGLVKQW